MKDKQIVVIFLLLIKSILFAQEPAQKVVNKDSLTTTTTLEEVILMDRKNTITYDKGTTKIDIENSPLASLPTPMDILSKLPEVQLSPDQESLIIIGKGAPLLYLNNQRISMQDLQTLPVDTIKSITLVPNPSAKYEAEGRAVLLITLKRTSQDRFKVLMSETAAFKRRFNNYLSLNTDFKRRKLELKGNLAYNQLHHWESNGSSFEIQSQEFEQEYLVRAIGHRPQFILGGGMYYGINETAYISAAANLKTQRDHIPLSTITSQRIADSRSAINTFSDQQEHRDIFRSNINYNKAFNNGNLFIGGQYAYYLRNLDDRIANQFDLGSIETSQIRSQDNRIDTFVTRFDLEFSLKNDTKLELGSNLTFAKSNAFSDFRFLDTASSELVKYKYKEDNYASYLQISKDTKRIHYSAGVRVEETFVKAGLQNEDQLLIDRKRVRIFPKAILEIPLDSTKSVIFNYAKSIQRPRYRDAIALTTFINPFLDWKTNINLLPTITHEVSANFQYKKQGVMLSYNYQKNPAYISVDFNEDRLVMSNLNFEQENAWQLRFQNSYDYQFWSVSSTLFFLWNKIKDSKAVLRSAKPYLYWHLTNEFSFDSKITLMLNFWGITRQQKGVFTSNARAVFGATLSKKFSKQLTLSINTHDIFRALNFEDRYTFNSINSVTTYFADAQELSFSVKYSFGDIKKAQYKNKAVDDALHRIN